MGLVAAVGTAVAATAVAADTAITVGLTLTTALEVTAAVGATIGAIGQITGNKDLAMAGMALGIVGGVGSLASSAGLLGSDASTAPLFGNSAGSDVTSLAADTGAADTTIAAGDTADSVAAPGDQIASAAAAGATPDTAIQAAATPTTAATVGTAGAQPEGDIINSLGQVNSAGVTPQASIANQTAQTAGNATDIVTGGNPTSALGTALNATPPVQTGIPAGAGGAPSIPGSLSANGDLTPNDIAELGSTNPAGEAAIQDVLAGAPASSPAGILSQLASFAKSNPLATYGVIQAAGSFASGAFNPVTPAQVTALNAQAAANNAAAGLTNQQLANMRSGVPGARLRPPTAPTTPAPTAPVTGTPQGLINQPQQAA